MDLAEYASERQFIRYSGRPHRYLRKRYDEQNRRWIVRYYRLYANGVELQSFETPLFTDPKNYIGTKYRVGKEQWFGATILEELANVAYGQCQNCR